MKNSYIKNIGLLFLLAIIHSIGFANTEWTTKPLVDGSWTSDDGNWIQTGYPGDYSEDNEGIGELEIKNGNNKKFIINIQDNTIITLYAHLKGSHGIEVNVKDNSVLIIEGNLTVQHNFKVNVAPNAQFIVNGHVEIQTNDNFSGELVIDGEMEITGNLTGNGSVSGNGQVSVGGVIEGISIDYEGLDVTLGGDDYQSPYDLIGNISSDDNNIIVQLNWSFESENSNFWGIQVFRSFNGGEFVIIADSSIKSGFLGNSYEDYLNFEENADNTAAYYVRAIYLVEGNIVYSKKSNTENFGNSPLPIELLHFSAQPASGEVVVEWSTAAEINNDFFTLERSIDGNNWETLTYINGAGNANYVINYSYTDTNPIEGVSYYRLKQTDFDGQFEYFAPAAVNFSSFVSGAEIIRVVPSAQRMEVWFQNQDPNAILTVADMQGRILYNSNARVADFVQQISINLPRNYSGEVVMVNLRTSNKTDEVKLIVR